MDITKIKKHYIIILAIMFVVVSLSDTTYSLFFKAESTDNFTYSTGNLDLEITEDKPIMLETAFPMIDSEAIKKEGYTLTIKNIGTLPYLFDLKMLSSTEENVIDTKYIKFKVNNETTNTLFATNNTIASNIMLYPNEQKEFYIKIWLDINTPNAELGKTFQAKILTTGEATYKTLDISGANHPELIDGMVPIYYDETTNSWKKADPSNIVETYEWYNYDNQKWANTVILKSSNKKIYDITRKNNIDLDEARTNNGNYISDESLLDLQLKNYNHKNISNIFRIKFNDLNGDKIYIISNGILSYYYDTTTSKFNLKIGNTVVSSNEYKIEKSKWYILGYTYNSNFVSFYIDGDKLSTKNITGNISTNNSFKIATDNTFEELSNLEVGDIYFYTDILTEEEIKNSYNQTINIIYDNLFSGYNDFEPKTLKEYYETKTLGTTINDEDINEFYVWIPRYKYRLWNVTGSRGIDSYNAYNTGIDIVFEKKQESSGVINCENNICYSDDLMITKVTNKDNGKYYTHPAFTTSNKELTGIWVSKYEVSTSDENCNNTNLSRCTSNELKVESKRGNSTWRNNYLSYFYQSIKKHGGNYNYHIIKNSEWGAVTYLTHSQYGLCQNDKCNKITANNTYISGNNLNDSTTLNSYGIFDMAGSATEFVMGNYTTNNNLNISNTKFGNTEINKEYYDLYQNTNFVLGDATKEVSLVEGIWNSNTATFIDETNNFFIRGGIGTTNNTGIFYYSATTDNPSAYISTRIVINK